MLNETATPLRGRAALLAAVHSHPYARNAIPRDHEPSGRVLDGATVWIADSRRGPVGFALGEPAPAMEFFAGTDVVAAGRWLHLPRVAGAELAGRFTVARHDEWEFRWTSTAPPRQPGEERVVRLTGADHDALARLIEESFPGTTSRPGDRRVAGWYGIRDGDRLVACGADRSQGDIGFVAGLTVHPDRRGRGLGAALTAAMTRDLLRRYDLVALGVLADNHGAVRLYRRLGYTDCIDRSSILLG